MAKRSENRKRSSAALVYIATFLFTMALLGSAVIALFTFVLPTGGKEKSSSSDSSSSFQGDAKQSMTLLAMGHATKSGGARAFVLLRYDAVESTLAVIPLPWQLTATVNTTTDTLTGFYKRTGAEGAARAVMNAAGITVPHYFSVDLDGFSALADILGGIRYTMPETIDDIDEESGLRFYYPKGNQVLDGGMLGKLYRYPKLGDADPMYPARLQGETTAALVNQNLRESLIPLLESSFKTAVNLADTNLSIQDYKRCASAVENTIRKNGNPAYVLLPDGTWEGETFTLSEATKEAIRERIPTEE